MRDVSSSLVPIYLRQVRLLKVNQKLSIAKNTSCCSNLVKQRKVNNLRLIG
jgi:hypothetical protein